MRGETIQSMPIEVTTVFDKLETLQNGIQRLFDEIRESGDSTHHRCGMSAASDGYKLEDLVMD